MAASVKVVVVPTGKDISDWIQAGASSAEIQAAIDAVPNWEPQQDMPTTTRRDTMRGTAKARPRFKIEPAFGVELYDMEHKEPLWVIRDLIHTGEILLAGREKSGKSFMALQLSLDVILERRALGQFEVTRPGKVLFFALEDVPRRITQRLRQLLPSPTTEERDSLKNLHVQFTLPALCGEGKVALLEHLERHSYSLVVIDPLVAILPGNRKHDIFRADYAETRMLREMAQEFGAAFLCLVHSRKLPSNDPRDLVAGTTGTGAGADSLRVLRRQPEGGATLHIISRETKNSDWALRFDLVEGGWRVTGSVAESELTEERNEILTLLKEEASLRPARIAALLRKNDSTTRRLLQKLHQDGWVMRKRDGSYCLSSEHSTA